jgi:hypothetical protein
VPAGITAIVEEVYKTVLSRRNNALNNMEELARIHSQGNVEGFRRDLMDYLEKSDWFDFLEEIALNQNNASHSWHQVVEEITESLQWRGILGDCRRLRNDYPDSPDLKVLTAIGRITSDGSVPDAINDIVSALDSINDRLGTKEASEQAVLVVDSLIHLDGDVEYACRSILLAILDRADYIEPKALIELSENLGEEFDSEETLLTCMAVTGHALARFARINAEEALF